MLKLRYEIEVIKKSNELDALDVEHELLPVAQVPAVDSTPNSLTQTGPKRYLSVWHRAALGALGAFLPSLYRIVILILTASMKDMHWYMHFLNVGFFTGILFLCIIGGVVASLIPKERATTALCVLVGISIVLFLQLGVMTFQEMTPPQMESKQLS